MSGRDFWESERSFDELIEQTRSADAFERWTAVFELGELGDARAAERLRLLGSDSDEFVREAARTAIAKLDPQVLRQAALDRARSASGSARRLRRARTHEELQAYSFWRTRPLPQPDTVDSALVESVIVQIVDVEGPICGRRVLALYGRCVSADAPSRLKNGPIRRAMKRLVHQGRLCRSDDLTSDREETWILHRPETEPIVVRQRGPRELREIPLNEVLQVLSGRAARGVDRSEALEGVVHFYGMEREMHKLANLLTGEWTGLLK